MNEHLRGFKKFVMADDCWKLTIIAILIGLASTSQGQINPHKDPNICGRPTCISNGKFNYTQDISYEYDYKVNVKTLFFGPNTNESTLHISSHVSLQFLSSCDAELIITDVKLSEKPDSYDREEDIDIESPQHTHSFAFASDLSHYSIRFAFHDGVISEICAQADEPVWVLNFKRGLLSMLQNTMRRFDMDHNTTETDVNGICSTSYILSGARESSLVINKYKDITMCQNRYKHHSIIQSIPYSSRSNQNQIPLMKSSSQCEITIDHSIYSRIECNERHKFQPFSNQDAGATTIMKQTLVLLQENEVPPKEINPIQTRKSLLYDHLSTPKPSSGELKHSRDMLKDMCKYSKDDIQIEFSDVFSKFIHYARLLSYSTLSTLYNRASSICPTGKKHILDALPFLGSDAAIQVMRDIILKKSVPVQMANEWLMSFAFIPRPSQVMLEAVVPLLQNPDLSYKVPLNIGTMVHMYCKWSPDCENESIVQEIISLIENNVTKLRKAHFNDRDSKEKVLINIKALGNLGIMSDSFHKTLKEIIEDDDSLTETRIAAVEAHRRLSCSENQNYFMELYTNINLDTEIRIASYLQAMRCPNYAVIQLIRQTLIDEQVNQVGSFVWTHLTNLLKSSIPSRVEIQGLLSDKDLGRKFSSDVRKFSHNYEGSLYFEEYNAGGSYELNTIFSPDSFIPRTLALNLTVDLFGESINLFEVYGRMEGFENYLESIFGPNRTFNSHRMKEKFSQHRIFRSADSTEAIKSQIASLPNPIENNFNNPKVGLGMKVFGNELLYNSYEGYNEIAKGLETINPAKYLEEILSGKEISYNKATVFMDTSYIVPSGTGLPVTLNAAGSAAINLKMSGSYKAPNFFATGALDLKGYLRPSMAVDILGTMSVDAFYASTGIKIKANLYSSSAVEGDIKIQGNQLVSVKFKLPKNKTEIFGIESKLIIMKEEKEEFQADVTNDAVSRTICTWPLLDSAIGLKMCTFYVFPNATSIKNTSSTFLFHGPTKTRMYIEKADPTTDTFLIEYKWEKNPTSHKFSLVFDTPHSQIERKISTNFTIDFQSQNVTLLIKSPNVTFVVQGNYIKTPEEQKIDLTLDVNGLKHFNGELGYKTQVNKYGNTYFPKFFLSVNTERIAELSGSLKWVTKKNVSQCDVDLKFETKKLKTRLVGYISKMASLLDVNLKLNYKFLQDPEHFVKLNFKIGHVRKTLFLSINADLKLETTAYPNLNFVSSLKYQKAASHLECKVEFNNGPNMEDERNKLTVLSVFSCYKTNNGTKLNTHITITKPISQLNMKFQIQFAKIYSDINTRILIRYAEDREIIIILYLSRPTKTLFEFDMALNVTLPSFTPMILDVKINEKKPAAYDVDIKATWFSGHSLTAHGQYHDWSTPVSDDHNLKLFIKSPAFSDVIGEIRYFRDNLDFKIIIQAKHNTDDYVFLLKHSVRNTNEIVTYAEVQYRKQVYNLVSTIDLKDKNHLTLELHLDQLRDIVIQLKEINNPQQKSLAGEIKWDSNRDPNQKLAASVDYFRHAAYNTSGQFLFAYPGRAINGHYAFALKDTEVKSGARLAWSPQDIIDVTFNAHVKNDDVQTLIVLQSELLTPFESWEKTSLNGGIFHRDNLYRINGSVYWRYDQYIAGDLYTNYSLTTDSTTAEFNSSLVSTIDDIPSIACNVKHFHDNSHLNSDFYLMYNPKQVIHIQSSWMLEREEHSKNLTGTVSLCSPFEGYRKGVLQSRIMLTDDKSIEGFAGLDLDNRHYTATCQGNLKKITNSNFVFNITTPMEKYKNIKGRFGLSEDERHAVAFVTYPQGAIGIEILLQLNSLSNFNLLFNVATPLDFLTKLLIIGKWKEEAVDFRGGWNTILIGFSGIWRFAHNKDFEYAYKLYTPIEGVEENGVTARLIFNEGLDMEASIELATVKLGVIIMGQPKSQILKGLGLKPSQPILLEPRPRPPPDSDEEELDESETEVEYGISWTSQFQVDTAIYPTIKGSFDIDQLGPLYTVIGTVSLPNGAIDVRDEFNFEDVFTINNRLLMTTPFPKFNQITSKIDLELVMGTSYLIGAEFNFKNYSQWVETGFEMNYTKVVSDDEENEIIFTSLNIYTPFMILPMLKSNGKFEFEENHYRGNVTLKTNSSIIILSGTLENDEGFLDTQFNISMTSPFVTIAPMSLMFKKDFSEIENAIEFGMNSIHVPDYKYHGEIIWKRVNEDSLLSKLNIQTPLVVLKNLELYLMFEKNPKEQTGNLNLRIEYNSNAIELNGTLLNEVIRVQIKSPLSPYKNVLIVLNQQVDSTNGNRFNLKGKISTDKGTYDAFGTYVVHNNIPVYVGVESNNGPGFQYKLTQAADGYGYAIGFNENHKKTFMNIDGKMEFIHKMNWRFRLDTTSSNANWNNMGLEFEINSPTPNNMTMVVNTRTPFNGIEIVRFGSNLLFLPKNAGVGKIKYELGGYKGLVEGHWKWVFAEDMQIKLINDNQVNAVQKLVVMDMFYKDPGQNYSQLQIGADFNVDKNSWAMGSNLTIGVKSLNHLGGELNIKLPQPHLDLHNLKVLYYNDPESHAFEYLAGYKTEVSRMKYYVSGKANVQTKANLNGNLKVEWGPNADQFIDNQVYLMNPNGVYQLNYSLVTPKFPSENTFSGAITYCHLDEYHNITAKIHYPESRSILHGQVDYKEFGNMNGTINSTTPFRTFPYLGANFLTETKSVRIKRYLLAFWPNNTALLDSIYTYASYHNDRSGKGKMILEIPLATRHTAEANYGYNEKPNWQSGFAELSLNKANVLDGKYECKSESRAGFEKDVIEIIVENKFIPFGVFYVHQIDSDAPLGDFIPLTDYKRAELYKLHNQTNFNITGEINVKYTPDGQIIKLLAHHFNRTVTLDTDYAVLDQQFLNKAKLQLSPDIWLGFDLNLLNKTFDESSDAQQIQIELSYPRRNVTAIGSYNVTKASLSSELGLSWDKSTKIKNVEAAFNWEQISNTPNRQQLVFELRHPSFERNVTFVGEYLTDKKNLADIKVDVEYANDPDRKLNMALNVQDHCTPNNRNYTFMILSTHPSTKLNLKVTGGVDYYSKYYHIYNNAMYKRTYLPLQTGETFAIIDIRNNQVEYKKATQRDVTYFWSRSQGSYPIYTVNVSAIHGADINATAKFYLNIHDKLVSLEGNRTPEATQSIHMYGNIPNVRSAYFDLWRDYDDIRISDISYYLLLNHSRLITSRLLWRPTLKSDVKEGIKALTNSLYEAGIENIEYWKQYIRSETADAVQDIWSDAHPLVEGFLNDMNDLNVLEEDAQNFKQFLNESYNRNEFYIKDIVGFAIYIVDELSIRDHIESVPDIVNEIWALMGESGKALRKSIQWLIETIKQSYQKAIQFMNDLMKGDALEHISKIFEYFIQKYDKFIKDLHVAFMKYIEKLWNDTYKLLVNHWNRMLAAIEPTFLKFIHYGETVIWNASREFLDFLYKRKHEIEESPYFLHIANFTQDVDHFYKDMINNNIITNIRKYGSILWQFIKEKYFTMIPFGNELHSVFNEIIDELKELKKLPSIELLLHKYEELSQKALFLYDYLEIGDRVQKMISILHMKITEITQTALESENRYREAKTKFTFDPDTGVMELEQKLPMSWHAFNETPRFQEIPEIKTINDIQNYIMLSNRSFWMIYYQYKPYTEPTTWLPPFNAYAMIIGNQHYITFDGKHYDFSGTCSYLLANDFVDGNFSVVVSYDSKDKSKVYKIDLLVDDVLIQIDLFLNSVKLLRKGITTRLPLQLKNVHVYQEAENVVVESVQGFKLTCNMKFDICKFHLLGWYYGKTAGLWGTMNNEPYDDFMTSTKKINPFIGRFAQSWALEPRKCRSTVNHAVIHASDVSEKVQEICDTFFHSKVSPLTTCFPIVDAHPFYEMCLKSSPENANTTTCAAAFAYIESCKMENTPLRIPEHCIQCSLANGTRVPEGYFLHMQDADIPQSADIVFVVEAKECNANITTNRNINQITSILHKELADLKLFNNRYAVVVFGGPGVYNKPRSIVVNNQIFGTHQTIAQYFENIPAGNGSSDIYSALSFAKNLVFRPGVSKSMILIPCTQCHDYNMRLDYTVLHQLLRENEIKLHVLMNSEFIFPKARVNKIFFGIDSDTSYTKKDIKELKGDPLLRKQVKLPKTDLGYCAPLALETNGSIFSAKKMENDKRGAIKKFATVFAKRIAQTAIPNSCQSCECTASNTGTSFLECLPCSYPSAVYIDYGFNEDEILSILQPSDLNDSLEDDLED